MAVHDANGKSNSLKKPSGDVDLFDQIQDEFDALLADGDLPEPQDIVADKQKTLTDLVLQDTSEFLSTTDMRAFEMSSDKPADALVTPEAADASDSGSPDSSDDETSALENETGSDESSSDETDTSNSPAETPEPAEAVVSGDNAITVETPPAPSSDTVEDSLPQVQENEVQEDDSVSEPDEEPEPITSEITDDASDSDPANKVFLQESDLSDAAPAEQAVDWPPKSDNHAPDLDGIDPFSDDVDEDALQEQAPVHPDMSEDHVIPRRGGARMVMFAGVIGLTVAGGIYWFTSGTQEPAKQLASGQEQSVSNTGDQQPALSTTPSATPAEQQPAPETIQAAAATLNKKDVPAPDKTVSAQPAETEKATIQRAAVEKAKTQHLAAKQAAEKRSAAEKEKAQRLAEKQATEKRAAAEKAKAQRLAEKQAAEKRAAAEKAKAQRLAEKQAAEKRAATEKAKAQRLAEKQAAEKRAATEKAKAQRLAEKQATEKRAVAEKSAARKIAAIQPSTQLQTLPTKSNTPATVADESGNWIIELASVNSDKSARQHMARIQAMGVESNAVQVNDKGKIFHSIRITGFTSKQEAMKRRDALAKLLGVRGARVEKL